MGALQRILVIDDDADIQEVVGMALEDFGGFAIAGCLSGAAAVARAPLFNPHLIMLDMAMPDMDGFTILQALRSIDSMAHTPVIFFTAKTTEPTTLQLHGVIGVIAKPFHHRQLVAQINALWDAHRHTQHPVPDSNRIAAIRERYLHALPERCAVLAILWTTRTPTALAMMHRQAHQLAGSGASLGCAEVSAAATALEQAIAPILVAGDTHPMIISANDAERIEACFARFDHAVRRSPEQPPQWSG